MLIHRLFASKDSGLRVLAIAFNAFLVASIAQGASITTTNLLTNPGAETGDISGWIIGGSSNPSVDSGSFNPGIDPHSGDFDFYGHTGPFGTLSQTVDLIGDQGLTAADINAGNLFADVSFWEQGLNQGTPSDEAQITLTFLDSAGATLDMESTPLVDSHNLTWQNGSGAFPVPFGTTSVVYTMNFIRNVGSDNDSYIDDNSLIVSNNSLLTATPEPASFGLLLTSGILLSPLRWRKRSRAN